jgi:hypothetical protein
MNASEAGFKNEYGPGNPEFKIAQKVYIKFLNRTGTVYAVKSGMRAGNRETYDVMLDYPLTEKSNDYLHTFDYDQITKLEE